MRQKSVRIARVCGVKILTCRRRMGRRRRSSVLHEYALSRRGEGKRGSEPKSWQLSCLALTALQQQPSWSLCWQRLGTVGSFQFMLRSCALSCARVHKAKHVTARILQTNSSFMYTVAHQTDPRMIFIDATHVYATPSPSVWTCIRPHAVWSLAAGQTKQDSRNRPCSLMDTRYTPDVLEYTHTAHHIDRDQTTAALNTM